MAITGLPVASSKGAAWGADVVAATQRYWLAPASSRDTTALLTVWAPSRPPANPPAPLPNPPLPLPPGDRFPPKAKAKPLRSANSAASRSRAAVGTRSCAAGPAARRAPPCEANTACAEYAAGPSSAAANARDPTGRANRRLVRDPPRMPAIPARAMATTRNRSQGFQCGLRSSSTNAQRPVAATIAERPALPAHDSRRLQNIAAPMAASAPTAGAMATE